MPVGDEADAAGPARELPSVDGQVPDASPAIPPPSNIVVDIEAPVIELTMPEGGVPAIGAETPIPDPATEAD
jgi:hypothetical protein